MTNHISVNEEELIKMTYEVLLGLKDLETHFTKFKDHEYPCELLYLSPTNIAFL